MASTSKLRAFGQSELAAVKLAMDRLDNVEEEVQILAATLEVAYDGVPLGQLVYGDDGYWRFVPA